MAENSHGKRSIERVKFGWEDNIKTNLD